MITPRLLRAYRRTLYRVGGIEVRIGRRSVDLDRLLRRLRAREAVLISAHNPYSRRMPKGWNERMHLQLSAAVSRTPALPAWGIWRGWSEEHLLVPGEHRKFMPLGRRFRQNGIVILRIGQPARLLATYQGTRSGEGATYCMTCAGPGGARP